MQVSLSFLFLGAFYLLQFIAAICINIILKMHYNDSNRIIDILLLVVQLFSMVLIPQYIFRQDGMFFTPGWNADLLFVVLIVFLLLSITRFFWLLRKVFTLRNELIIPRAIRETIDHLPGGICLSTPGGSQVLANYRINELVFLLTNNTIMNMKATWEELRRTDSANGCMKLKDPWIFRSSRDGADGKADTADEGDCVYFSLPDSSVWKFRKEDLTDRIPNYIQLEATEITDLYRYSKALYDNNVRLSDQYRRQQAILENIVEINHEKEILATKIRLHDDLGRSLLTTKQHLFNQTLIANITTLTEIWNTTIRNLTDVTQLYANPDASPELELQKAADMVGCRINFSGDRPSGRKTPLLFYAAVREALTNAVKHAGATQLNVYITATDRGYHVEISDNGQGREAFELSSGSGWKTAQTSPCSVINEGGGLSNLRQKLEQEGATLEFKCTGRVTLVLELPAERIDTETQENKKNG